MPAPLPLEGARTRSLLRYLNGIEGGFFFKIHGSAFQPRLIDIIGCYRGSFVSFEVKRPGRQPTPRQRLTISQIQESGGSASVIWSIDDIKTFFDQFLDKRLKVTYSSSSSRDRSRAVNKEDKKNNMPAAKSKKAKAGKAATATKSKSKSKAQDEDELEDLDELDDLDDDDFEGEDEDEDEEDEDEEDDEDEDDDADEDEPVKVVSKKSKNDATQAKAKASKKAGPVTSKKETKAPVTPAKVKGSKSKGNASNLVGRKLAEGMVGAGDIAKELGVDGRAVRLFFRKEGIGKNAEGLYSWKNGSREHQSIMKKAKAHFA